MNNYCVNCGAELPTDALFCSKCGKKQTQETKAEQKYYDQVKVTNNVSEKDSYSDKSRLIDDLKNARAYFKHKQTSYDEFDDLLKAKEGLSKASGCGLFILGVILAFIIFFIISFNSYISSKYYNILFFTMMFFGGIVFPIVAFNKSNAKVDKDTKLINEKLKKIESELTAYFNAYSYGPVSFKYSNPKIIDVLKENISSGRADNLKESIRCMLDDFYKQQMLTKQDEISENVKKAKNSANAAALFSAGTFLNTRKK